MKLMVLDGNSIINRAFFGVRLLSTKDGVYTNAVFGFLNILNKLMGEETPDALSAMSSMSGIKPSARVCPMSLQCRCPF